MKKKLLMLLPLMLILVSCSDKRINVEDKPNKYEQRKEDRNCSHYMNPLTDKICKYNNICISSPSVYKYYEYINCGDKDADFEYYILDSLIYLQLNYEFEMYDVSKNERDFSRIRHGFTAFGAEAYIADYALINWDYATKYYVAYEYVTPYAAGKNDGYFAVIYRSDCDDYAVIMR